LDIQILDELACNGHTTLHESAPAAKVVAAGALLAATILAGSPGLAVAVVVTVAVPAWLAGQPIRKTIPFALYPLVFAAIFAVSVARSNPSLALLVVIRAFAAGFIMITLLTTTSFVDVFALLGSVLPVVVADAMFMAYKAFFVLMGELSDLLVTIRLRGADSGARGPRALLRTLRNYGEILGVLILHSVDMTERTYRVMQVRGYSGRIRVEPRDRRFRPADLAIVTYSLGVLLGVLVLR
jgi:cobalt/nickel transport system permease protein